MRERRWSPFCRWHPQLGPAALFLILHWATQALSCYSSVGRQTGVFRSGGAARPFYAANGGNGGGGHPTIIVNGNGEEAQVIQGAARAAPNVALNPIGGAEQQFSSGQSANAILGNRVGIAEFSSDGYNSQGGGPVSNDGALNCNFEGQPCCWANVPTPSDDQIDWQLVQGRPDSVQLRNVTMDGRYLVAYASGAAPSDEAQLSSCAIACASSPVRVRARHWQSYNVLLQVCQRESFPTSIGYNPLLNCQEFPSSSQVAHTELVLPKASYVDIVFVASNFIDERGDVVFLDDIEVLYESDPPECGDKKTSMNSAGSYKGAATQKTTTTTAKGGKGGKMKLNQSNGNGNNAALGTNKKENAEEEGIRRAGSSANVIGGPELAPGIGAGGGTAAAVNAGTEEEQSASELGELEGGRGNGDGGIDSSISTGQNSIDQVGGVSSGNTKAHGVVGKSGGKIGGSSSSSSSSIKKSLTSISSKTSSSSSKSESFKSSITKSTSSSSSQSQSSTSISSLQSCPWLKCSFEDGTSCAYSDTTNEPESMVRGLTTRFETVKGQFMNRVTGVKEGTEGNYYAAVFLYPREKAGLWANVANVTNNGESVALAEETRLRFQYYEGTHGVQLKGCCAGGGSNDESEQEQQELTCPFQSDKFVSVSDRMWKWGTFACPQGTKKIIFLCENTRTNQGACAMDDIAVVENRPNVNMQDKPIC